MGCGIEMDEAEAQGRLFLAGERVRAGRYRLVGRRSGDLVLEEDGVLPASLDGRVACYVRLDFTWSQIVGRRVLANASLGVAAWDGDGDGGANPWVRAPLPFSAWAR